MPGQKPDPIPQKARSPVPASARAATVRAGRYGSLQQTLIAAPRASRNSGTPASSTARLYGWFCRGLPPGHRGLLLCPRERKVSDATYIPVTRTGGTCGNGSCRRDDERRKCELLLWQGDAAMLPDVSSYFSRSITRTPARLVGRGGASTKTREPRRHALL